MINFQKIKTKIAVYFLLLVANSQVVFAQKGGLIPCSGLDCDLCDLLVLAKNVINFLIGISVVLAAAFFAWGALVIMTAGLKGSEQQMSRGREIIWIAVIGAAIALGAWVIIGTIVQIIAGSPSYLPWTEIQCTF